MKILATETETLIVGAGLSGLYLASLLHKQKKEFQVIEARDRIGGRILTRTPAGTGSENNFYDLGPSWFWPGQPRIAKLITALNLSVFEQFSQGRLVYEDEGGNVQRDLNYSTMAGSLRVDGGMSALVEGLRQECPKTSFNLSHQLTAINQTDGEIIATVQSAESEKTIRTDNLILCMPPRVISSSIQFTPEMPDQIQNSMLQIPTWMAGHAKFVAIYSLPFWREMGLSGDAMSRCGPLMEIHDASPINLESGGLFGFVGVPAHSLERDADSLKDRCLKQLIRLFGEKAAEPVDLILKDWASDPFTATADDNLSGHHPSYGLPSGIEHLESSGIFLGSTETASQFGGFIEGALEAAENVAAKLSSPS